MPTAAICFHRARARAKSRLPLDGEHRDARDSPGGEASMFARRLAETNYSKMTWQTQKTSEMSWAMSIEGVRAISSCICNVPHYGDGTHDNISPLTLLTSHHLLLYLRHTTKRLLNIRNGGPHKFRARICFCHNLRIDHFRDASVHGKHAEHGKPKT